MTDIEQVLLNRVKLIGDGEWSLIGTPQELIDEINRLIVDKQLEILKGLKKMCKRRDTAMGDNTFVACVFESEIEQQIDELSNNLSKGDGDGTTK